MKKIISNIQTSILAALGLGIICTVLYPLAVWAVGQIAFNHKANGSLIERDGKVIGSELIGQNFASARYFHSRPSAAGVGYDASSSGGSNLGPISGKFLNGAVDDPKTPDVDESFLGLKQRVEAYRDVNHLSPETIVPVDAVTASASGLDPHISLRNAELQLPRVAKERGIDLSELQALVGKYTEGRSFGFLGEPGVNVLKLNIALDSTM
jgi:K+-transporting ATPase ATPase C chain